MKTEPKINLGDLARDTVTGFTGICVCRTEWLNGCWRPMLQSQELDKDGKPREGVVFDDHQLELIKPRAVPTGSKETGGPRDNINDNRPAPTR